MENNCKKNTDTNIINVIHGDSLEAMESMPDNKYQLAICDPEYGIGISKNPFRQKQKKKNWDIKPANESYFNMLFSVSMNQIIWGGNYFDLPPTQGFLIWDKKQPFDFSSSMCEYAWMSFQKPAKIFNKHVVTAEKNKIHVTQKPVALYKWLLKNYAKPGDKIIDTHGGSMSHAIAAIDMGFSLDIYEIDDDYYHSAVERIKRHVSQLDLSRPPCKINYITN